MTDVTTGLYRPGDSIFHRLPAGIKLASLVILGIFSVWMARYWYIAVTICVAILICYRLAGFGMRIIVAQIRPALWFILFALIVNTLTAGWHKGVGLAASVSTLIWAAALLTLTTQTSTLVDTVVYLLTPAQRFGINPHRVGVILLIGLRCVPVIASIARQVHEAQVARCATRSIRAFAVPLIVRALSDAEAISEALIARGFDD